VHGAADSAERTDAADGTVVPRPRDEAVTLRRQRADRADRDRIPDELGLHRQGERRVDLAGEASFKSLEGIVAGDDLSEAHAPPAQDASLAIQHEHRPQ